MNPEAAVYIPSFTLRRKVRDGAPVAPYSAGPHPVAYNPSLATATVSPMVMPREAPQMTGAASMPTPVLSAAPLSAADRIRLLHPRHPPTTDKASQHASASATPAASVTATPAIRGAPAAAATPSAALTPLMVPATTAAAPISAALPTHRGVIRYTRAELLALEGPALDAIRRGPIADAPPFTRLPASFVHLLNLPYALEFVNVDAASALTEGRHHTSPFLVTSSNSLPSTMTSAAAAGGTSLPPHPAPLTARDAELVNEKLHFYHCLECSQGGPHPCDALATVVHNAKRYIMTQPLGRCLLQSPDVVWGQLQLALVFEAKQSSLRLRMLAERSPAIVRRVGDFLFGEGYHLPLPKVTAHEEWRTAMQMLKFDAIRDNRTRVVTDLSKQWKKRHTQFEQFVSFFSYRDDVPVTEVKNMLTRSVKPGMVAMLTGDVVAVILLHHLGFFIPPDYYWSVFPFLGPALGEGTLTHDVVRHLGCYFSAKQDPNLYNPVTNPFAVYLP